MKFKLLVGLICILPAMSVVATPIITVDSCDGSLSANAVPVDQSVRFLIRYTNSDAVAHKGITNGYRVYSPEGATWTTTTVDTLGPLGKTQFDGGFFLTLFSATGSGSDTVGCGAFVFFNPGIAAGFDDTVFSVTVGPFTSSGSADQICIDSSFYPPSGVWKWAGPDVYPNWGGPYCYFIVNPASPPTLVGAQPNRLSSVADNGAQPSAMNFTVYISDESAIPVTFSGALTDKAGGDFTFVPSSGTNGTEVTVHIEGRDLDLGLHHGIITLTAGDADNGTYEIPILLNIKQIVTDVTPVPTENLPTDFTLSQNYPNPFNPTTEIAFSLPNRSHVTLTVYNVLGQQVATLVDKELTVGSYVATWDGRSSGGNAVASGIYFYRLHTEQFTETRKMVLLK